MGKLISPLVIPSITDEIKALERLWIAIVIQQVKGGVLVHATLHRLPVPLHATTATSLSELAAGSVDKPRRVAARIAPSVIDTSTVQETQDASEDNVLPSLFRNVTNDR